MGRDYYGGNLVDDMTSVHFSSQSNEWATPQNFFNQLNEEFDFNLDPCATNENNKCDNYFTEEQDGLKQNWDGYRVFCNPPYGREIGKWVEKASKTMGGIVVMLIPARTDTRYFHEYIYQKPNVEIRFLKGRLKFGDSKNSAPFPSMLVIFRSSNKRGRAIKEIWVATEVKGKPVLLFKNATKQKAEGYCKRFKDKGYFVVVKTHYKNTPTK